MPDRHGHLRSPWGAGGGRELCDVALLSYRLARALEANLKNDDSTVSITNTGCIRCDNRCRVHIDEMFLFFDSFPVCIGICENHTGQIESFLFFDLFPKRNESIWYFFCSSICYINVRWVISDSAPGLFTSTHCTTQPQLRSPLSISARCHPKEVGASQ
jgi:hypothetical protein